MPSKHSKLYSARRIFRADILWPSFGFLSRASLLSLASIPWGPFRLVSSSSLAKQPSLLGDSSTTELRLQFLVPINFHLPLQFHLVSSEAVNFVSSPRHPFAVSVWQRVAWDCLGFGLRERKNVLLSVRYIVCFAVPGVRSAAVWCPRTPKRKIKNILYFKIFNFTMCHFEWRTDSSERALESRKGPLSLRKQTCNSQRN